MKTCGIVFWLMLLAGGTALSAMPFEWNLHATFPDQMLTSITAYTNNDVWTGSRRASSLQEYSIYRLVGGSWVGEVRFATWVSGLSAWDDSNVWAVGWGMTGVEGTPMEEYGECYFYDGSEWNMVFNSGVPKDVQAVGLNDVFVAGTEGLYQYDGSDWNKVSDVGGVVLAAIDSNNVWTVSDGRIHYFNGTSSVLQLEAGVYGIHALDAEHVWAGGSDGAIYYYDGSSWSLQSSFGSGHTIYDVVAVSEDDVWAVGVYGRIYHYDGFGWSLYETLTVSGDTPTLVDIDVSAEGDLWVSGDTIFNSYVFNTTRSPHGEVPEPSTVAVVFSGVGLFLWHSRRRWSSR